jgi:hypothetical protein
LELRGLREDTVVCVLSDHGEEFMEHGRIGHGHGLYEALLHVPWILSIPGSPARRVEKPVSLVDLFPTLLSAAGIDHASPPGAVDRLRDPAREGEQFAEHKDKRSYRQSIRRGDLKLIRSFKRSEVAGPARSAPPSELLRVGDRYAVELQAGLTDGFVASRIKARPGGEADLIEVKGRLEAATEVGIGLLGLGIALTPETEVYGETVDPEGRAVKPHAGLPVKAVLRAVGDDLLCHKLKLYAPDAAFEPELRGIAAAIHGDRLHIGLLSVSLDEQTVLDLGADPDRLDRTLVLERLRDPSLEAFVANARLFELAGDRDERAPLASHPAIVPLERRLDEFGARISTDPLWTASDRAALSAEDLEALRAIGYAR